MRDKTNLEALKKPVQWIAVTVIITDIVSNFLPRDQIEVRMLFVIGGGVLAAGVMAWYMYKTNANPLSSVILVLLSFFSFLKIFTMLYLLYDLNKLEKQIGSKKEKDIKKKYIPPTKTEEEKKRARRMSIIVLIIAILIWVGIIISCSSL